MGKWNRRYLPRQKFRQYEYEDPPLSPNNSQSYPSGTENVNLPSWEIDYCKSLRVSWRKVIASKKYIYSYPSVLNWDDSACKEAFDDAKQRFWATVNGIPYDVPLPNPDMFIDDIDWNPYLDPELMKDLDCQFFNPDDEHKAVKLGTIDEELVCLQTEENKNQSIDDNPWERNHMQGFGSEKNVTEGWNKRDDFVNLKISNPWEQCAFQLIDSSKANAWGSGNASSGWSKWQDNNWPSSAVDNKFGDACYSGNQDSAVSQGRGCTQSNSRGWNNWNSNNKKVENNEIMWENDCSSGPKERGLAYNWNGSWSWRDSSYQVNEPNHWDSGRFKRVGRSFRGGCRKRESSVQYTSNKSSRYQVPNHGDSHWV